MEFCLICMILVRVCILTWKYIYVKILARLCIGVGALFSFFLIKVDCSFV